MNRNDLAWLTSRPIAHRGLHDGTRPENTIAAFAAGAAAGYALECDVHLSADNVPMVFHDDDLERLTGRAGPLAALSASDLGRLPVEGSSETIPAFDKLLDLVAGRVPLLVEIKPGIRQSDLVEALVSRLRAYAGPVALMSFDASIVAAAKRADPDRACGLTAEGRLVEGLRHFATARRLGADFMSYAVDDLPTAGPILARRLLGIPLLCWTVRYPAQMETARRWTDQITFEGFRP